MNLVFSVYFVVAVAKSVPALLSPLTSEPNNLIYKCTCHNNFLYFFCCSVSGLPASGLVWHYCSPFFCSTPQNLVCSALIKYTFFVCLLLTRCYLIRFFGLFFAFHYGSHVNFFFISYSLFFRICSLTAKLAMYRHLYKLPPLINYEWLNFNFTFKIHTLAYLLFFVTFSNCCVLRSSPFE